MKSFILFVLLLASSKALAQVPQIITHQGFLADSAGQPVTGTLPMTVRLFTDSLSGTEALTQSFIAVNINNGVYTLLIDVSTLSSGWQLNQYWLEMEVNTSVLSPRIRLTSVPYALYASKADTASQLADANGDTRIDVDDQGDPDVIHFHVAGSERWTMRGARLEPLAAGGNVFIGLHAGRVTTSTGNTFIGNEAGYANTTGPDNTFVGFGAGVSNNIGSGNSFLGKGAGNSNTQGYYNSFFGRQAGSTNSYGNINSFFGSGAGLSNSIGSDNSFFGADAGYSNTTSSFNSFFGAHAGQSNTEGYSNSSFGTYAGRANTLGYNNSFFGYAAGYSNTTGNENAFFGKDAGFANTTGSYNAFFGSGAGRSNTGFQNAFFGEEAGYYNNSGFYNSFFGELAGVYNTSGYSNTFIGINAGIVDSSSQYFNSTALGTQARVTASNQARIGDFNVTSIGGYANWTNLSDGRFKTHVADDVKGLDFILELRPVTYNLDMVALERALNGGASRSLSKMRSQEKAQMTTVNQAAAEARSKVRYSGFVAQEVEQTAKALGYDFSGIDAPKNDKDFYGLRYAEFVVPLVKAIQEQQALIKQLRADVEKLKSSVK